MMRSTVIAFISVLILLWPSDVSAEKRVALVVGNAAYQHAGVLTNPVNDAHDIATVLNQLGFQVILGTDLNKSGLDSKVREFARALDRADVGLFFYAGHGVQVAGINYLVATDAKLEAERDIDFETVKVEFVLSQMEREAKTNIVFLDACRNNPLARNLARTMGTRGVNENNGLAPIKSGLGTFIAFATQPGNVASDGAGRNSPFSAALKRQITAPRISLTDVMIEVRNEVVSATKGAQVPWDHSALRGRFYFNITVNVLPQPTRPQLTQAADEWSRVDKTSIVELETFLRRNGSSPEADYARARLADLKKNVLTPPLAPRPAQPQGKSSGPQPKAPHDPVSVGALRDCALCPQLVIVPANSFMIGGSRRITIKESFAIGKYEITFDEWTACVAEGGCSNNKNPDDMGWGKGRRPVINVNWNDAKEYVSWISRKTGKPYRLPSEAEWEYAARSGSSADFTTGDRISPNEANFNGGTGSVFRQRTIGVGSFAANVFGLHDVHGNVSEWVEDCWNDSLDGVPTDGSARGGDCRYHVIRGGSWAHDHGGVSMLARFRTESAVRGPHDGFRVAKSLPK